ncbi:MAG: PGPGW domain-containing protein [Thermoanaerobaculia bacterium]
MPVDPDPVGPPPREEPFEEPKSTEPPRLSRLPLPLRVTLLVVGWLLVLLGIPGLILPGLQGILSIVLGLAIASLGSERIHRFLHDRMHPWPRARKRMEALRARLHRWLSR